MNVKEGDKKKGGAVFEKRGTAKVRGAYSRAVDAGAAALGFLFGGCHIAFGAYPLGIALVSSLPTRAWYALAGVVLGSLLRAEAGIIYAMAALLSVLLRIIISGAKPSSEGDEGSARVLFGESLPLRVCSAVISSFVPALYEILLVGISWAGVLYGAAMMLLSGIGCALFSCAFYHGVGVRDLIFSHNRIFSRRESGKARIALLLFKLGLLSFIFATSLSFSRFSLFGIDLSYVFASAITMLAAKRFGAVYGAAVGFVSAVGVSGIYSPAFLLCGTALGILFPFGAWTALAVGAVLSSVWCAYVGGVSGFLTVLPEFSIASLLMMPLFRYLEREREPERSDSVKRRATDMVGTMALSYRDRREALSFSIEAALLEMSRSVKEYLGGSDAIPTALIAKMIGDAAKADAREREMNEGVTDKLEALLAERGFFGGVIRGFGIRRPYVICAAEDRDGDRISSPAFLKEIEEVLGAPLRSPEYYRRADMVVMVAECRPAFSLEGAYAGGRGERSDISGDTLRIFETENNMAWGIISDGMGSGEEARRTSEFIASFLADSLGTGASVSSIIDILNSTIRARGEECGASVDLFSLDLISGEAFFVKSGAAPSFIKRGRSLFKIASTTLPVGVMSAVDAERIGASVADGDYVIMLSDGVAAEGDAPWLVELLNRPNKRPLREYAEYILREAENTLGKEDDRSVMVLKIKKIEN